MSKAPLLLQHIEKVKTPREESIPVGSPSPAIRLKNPVVFLSYIYEDKETVARLKRDLTARGVEIWLDKEQIQPGDQWKKKIGDAIRSCRFAIICLSNKALSKEGYFQKENVELGHCRLSIKDLSDRAKQPFISPDSSVAVIVNGGRASTARPTCRRSTSRPSSSRRAPSRTRPGSSLRESSSALRSAGRRETPATRRDGRWAS